MALDYIEENEGIPDEQENQNVQRTTPVTPYYSIILIGCVVIVWLFQIAFVPDESALFGGQMSADLAGFDKQAFLNGEY